MQRNTHHFSLGVPPKLLASIPSMADEPSRGWTFLCHLAEVLKKTRNVVVSPEFRKVSWFSQLSPLLPELRGGVFSAKTHFWHKNELHRKGSCVNVLEDTYKLTR